MKEHDIDLAHEPRQRPSAISDPGQAMKANKNDAVRRRKKEPPNLAVVILQYAGMFIGGIITVTAVRMFFDWMQRR